MGIRLLKRAPVQADYPDDSALIQGITNNERKALDTVYQQSFGQIKQFILHNNGSEQDAEDIFQEGLLAVWRNIKSGKYENQKNVKLSTYVFQVCKYRWFEHLKSAKAKYSTRLNPEYDIVEEDNLAQLQEEEERASYLRSLFEQLGEKCQQILNLYYYKKKSLAEIAQEMDYTPQSAKNEKISLYATSEGDASGLKNKIAMEVSEILMDRMDKYLEGAMSEEEIKAFESELQTNSELARAFEQHKETILTIESIGMKDEIAEVIRQNRNQGEKKARTVSFNRSAIAVAASIVILIGAFFFLKPSGTSSGPSLYSSLYQADPGLPTLMGATDNPIFSDAMVSYKEGKYQEALESFNVLSVANPGNDTLAFYQGICYLELNRTQESIQSFDQIDPSKPIWGNKAAWYKAMAMLKADEVQNAREILEQIATDNNHRYQKEAQSALVRMSE